MARLTKQEKVKVGIGAGAIVLIILVAATAHLRAFDFLRIWPVSEGRGAGAIDEPRNQTERYAVDNVKGLNIDWVGDDISIVTGDVDQVEVTEEIGAGVSKAAAEPASISLAGNGTLSISDDTADNAELSDIRTDGKKRLTITLPASAKPVLDNVSIDGVYVSFAVKGAAIGNLSLDGIGSDMSIEGEVRDRLSIDGMQGDLSLKLTGDAPRGIELDGMLGDIEIALPQGSGFIADVDGMSGGFASDLPIERDGSSYRSGDGATEISVSGMTGDVHIAG